MLECRGKCHDSCGPIELTTVERSRIDRESGIDITPDSFWRGGSKRCEALTMLNRCGVYSIRPLICRLWGATKRLPCTYGCKPERVLSEPESYELIARAYEISGQHDLAAMFREGVARSEELEEIRDYLDLEYELLARRKHR